jgi:hypothetical protein
MKKNGSVFVSALFFFFTLSSGAAGMAVVNPVAGVWANRQMLVLDLSDGEEAFYSLNGSDPASSGFAYDEPVLLDVDGPVELRITFVSADGAKHESNIAFTVKTADLPQDAQARNFITSVTGPLVTEYTAGSQFVIPSSLSYYLGLPSGVWIPGSSLSLSSGCVFTQFVPCTVTDGSNQWRFIIQTHSLLSGTFSRRVVPFKISDWSSVVCTDKKYIYRIDDGMWMQPGEPVSLDRSNSHVIYWQSIAFEKGNPVQSFSLPQKPNIVSSINKDGMLSVTAGGNGFRLGIINEEGNTTGLFDTIGIDAFIGDEASGILPVGIYYDSVYQGREDIPYDIDKKPPAAPVITSSSTSCYSRKAVNLDITAEKGSVLYTAMSSPVIIPQGKDYKQNELSSMVLFNQTDFKKASGETASLTLSPSSDDIVYYKVDAYAVDSSGNRGAVAEYSVIIDVCNFYLNASADTGTADGSREHPFADFASCLKAVSGIRYAHIHVSGSVTVPEGPVVLISDCVFDGQSDARFLFKGSSTIIVRSAGLTVNNCVMTLESPENDISEFFKLEHSVLTVEDSEISAVCGKNGVLINSDSSVINVKDSAMTIQAASYSSCLASVDTDIKIQKTRINASAATAVCLSVQNGNLLLDVSSCSITGDLGHIAELFNVHATITGSTFIPDLKKYNESSVIYKDDRTVLVNTSNNTTQVK